MMNHSKQVLCKRATGKGFSLMEMMAAVVIIGIMASIAFASYQSSIIKTKRKAALSTLMEITSEEENYFVNNKGYATDLTDLGYPVTGAAGAPYYIDDNGNPSTNTAGSYKISFVAGASARAYALIAEPINMQAKDTQCATLGITSAGSQSVTGTLSAPDCFR